MDKENIFVGLEKILREQNRSEEDIKEVYKAYKFAEKLHDGQYRVSEEPYIIHPVEVTKILATLKVDTHTLMASILHDTIEDTGATKEEIESLFGKDIANGVSALTKNKSLPKEIQMKDSLERIKKQPFEIAIVKVADRMFNIRDRVESWNSEKQEQYKEEARLICEELGELFLPAKEALEEQIEKY